MKKTVITALGLLSCVCAFAQNQQVIQDGTSFINGLVPTKPGDVVNASGVNSQKWSGQTATGNTTPKGLGTFSNPTTSPDMFNQAKIVGLTGMGNNAMTRCENYVPTGDGVKDQECAAVNFLSQRCLTPAGNQAKIINANGGMQASSAACNGSYGQGANKFDFANQLQSSDSVFNLTKSAVKNAGNTTGQVCSEKLVTTKPAETETNNCFKSTNTNQETCSQILRASCSRPGGFDGCDQGGIVPGSWAGDMATSFAADGNGDYTLSFGTFADNYWRGWGTTYDRTLNFEIKDPGIISKFILTRASFDDWLMVQINGVVVYVGPYGGNQLSVVNRQTTTLEMAPRSCLPYWDEYTSGWYCGTPVASWDSGTYLTNTKIYDSCYAIPNGMSCSISDPHNGSIQYSDNSYGGPELSTNWNFGLNVDMKPYLRTGNNTLFMRTIVAGAGEGAIQMKTRQYCPPVCSSFWEDQCTSQENRAGMQLGAP